MKIEEAMPKLAPEHRQYIEEFLNPSAGSEKNVIRKSTLVALGNAIRNNQEQEKGV